MHWLAYLLLLPGGAFACINFFLSFVAAPLHKVRHGVVPERVASGFPLIGTLFLLYPAFTLPFGSALQLGTMLLILLDTGGPHWFIFMLLRKK
jgi:hypothetical protein